MKNDTEKALVMLRPGGTIVWHDFAAKTPGVVRYIAEFAQSRPVFRIKHTSLIVILDGVDAMAFKPLPRMVEGAAVTASSAGLPPRAKAAGRRHDPNPTLQRSGAEE